MRNARVACIPILEFFEGVATMKTPTTDFLRSCVKLVFAMIGMAGLLTAALAQSSGQSSGQIGSLFTVASSGGAPGNYDFRVYFVGSPVICNGQPWAYVNIGDANYAAIVANILAARASGATVLLNWTQQANGYCQINFISW
jgi:hypothetical protein